MSAWPVLQAPYMFPIVTLILALPPSEVDLGLRFREPSLPQLVAPLAPQPSEFSSPPMVTSEGHTARLLSDEDLARVKAIDSALSRRNLAPIVVQVLGALAVSVPVGYCAYFAAQMVVQSLRYAAVLIVLSPFTFALGFALTMVALPLPLLLVGGLGLAVLGGGSILANLQNRERNTLMKERLEILAKAGEGANKLPGVTPLTTVTTF